MNALDPTLAAKLAKLIPVLGSDKDGEVISAVAALKRTLEFAGQDFHFLADLIAKPSVNTRAVAEARHKAYRKGWDEGWDKGRACAEENRNEPSGEWRQIAKFWAGRANRLQKHEQQFVRQMDALACVGGLPSEKQGNWLLYLYSKLGGRRGYEKEGEQE